MGRALLDIPLQQHHGPAAGNVHRTRALYADRAVSPRPRTSFRRLVCTGWAAALMAVSGVAGAVTSAIDDSGTVVLAPSVPMRWQALSARQRDGVLMVGSTTVRVRLNVTPWLQRAGRTYLVLPAQHPGAIRAAWASQRPLLSGDASAGSRPLFYSEPTRPPFVEEALQLAI